MSNLLKVFPDKSEIILKEDDTLTIIGALAHDIYFKFRATERNSGKRTDYRQELLSMNAVEIE